MTRRPVPPPPVAPFRGAVSPAQAKPVRSTPPPPLSPLRGLPPALQAKSGPVRPVPPAAPVFRPPPRFVVQAKSAVGPRNTLNVIQRAAPLNLAAEPGQATYLSATNMTTGAELCSNLASQGGAHSEDRLIDEVLPAAAIAGSLTAGVDNIIYIGINRSPCTSTDHAHNGQPSCNKAGGAPGCAERLAALVAAGFVHGGTAYPIRLVLQVRNLYGSNSAEQANSALAIEAMTATGRIACDTQRTASSGRFMGTGAAKTL